MQNSVPFTYDQFVQDYSHQIRAAYKQRNGHDSMNESDLAHQFWRMSVELWTLKDIIQDILTDKATIGAEAEICMPRPRGFVHSDNYIFRDEQNNPWCLAADTMHLLLPRMLHGEDITPVLKDSYQNGSNTIVVIGMHRSNWKKQNNYEYDPGNNLSWEQHWNLVDKLVGLCDSLNLRLYYRSLADVHGNDVPVDLPLDKQQQAWNGLSRYKDVWNFFATIGNEGGANGWNPNNFSRLDLGRVLQSKGSSGAGDMPYLPAWDIADFESGRELKNGLLDANGIELRYGRWNQNPNGVLVSTVNIEPAFFYAGPSERKDDRWECQDHVGDWRWSNPMIARRLGAQIGSMLAGGGFGCSEGMEGRIPSSETNNLRRAFYQGLYFAYWAANGRS